MIYVHVAVGYRGLYLFYVQDEEVGGRGGTRAVLGEPSPRCPQVLQLLFRIVYGRTKGFVSLYVTVVSHTLVFPYACRFPLPHFIRLYPLSLPLPSRRSRVPASAVVL
jgi:hypothetical protein